MKQSQLPTLAHFERSSDEVSKYFTQKYSSSYQVIKQLQHERKLMQTPLLEAQRTLKTLQLTKRNTSRQSDRMKVTSTTSFSFSRPATQFDTFIQSVNSFDLNAASVLLSNLKWIMDCLHQKDEIPNFQLYWESVCEFKWEQYIPYFSRPQTQTLLQNAILYMDISMAFIQCQLKENMIHNYFHYSQEMSVLSKLLLENFAQYLNRILLKQNITYQDLRKKLDTILCKSVPCLHFVIELKRNTSFIKSILDKILQNDNPNISPLLITCRHLMQNNQENSVSRQQLINAIYLSTTVIQRQEYQSPLKSLFKTTQGQHYDFHLRQSYSQLEPVQAPYLKEPFNHQLCIILDLDETMGHFDDKIGKFLSRPKLLAFLQKIHSFCEIVLFTAGLQSYADHAIQELQCEDFIHYRLYRQHTTLKENGYVKDLSKLGRPLERTIIIDNTPNNFELQQENGLLVSSWIQSPDDNELEQLGHLLEKIACCKDVRIALRKYRDYINQS